MPILGIERLEEITLPSGTSRDPAIVVLNLAITSGQADDYDSDQDRSHAVYALILSCMKSWNFLDHDGNPAEITIENLRKLHPKDTKVLADKVFGEIGSNLTAQVVSSEEKKD